MMITSTANSRIKEIRKLRDRKERQQMGLFFAEGIRVVAEAIQSQVEIETLLIAPELLQSSFACKLVDDQKNKGVDIFEVSGSVFESVASKENPQGIAAVIHQRWCHLDDIKKTDGIWVALDAVQNPGNLGTILRTNDAIGGDGVILLDQSTDPYDISSIRGSMGAIFSQKLVRTSFEKFTNWKNQTGWYVTGASGDAELDYQDVSYPQALILLMGSERMGLHEHHKTICNSMVKIPMIGRSDSLNLAVATAVMLYEIFNQRRRQ